MVEFIQIVVFLLVLEIGLHLDDEIVQERRVRDDIVDDAMRERLVLDTHAF